MPKYKTGKSQRRPKNLPTQWFPPKYKKAAKAFRDVTQLQIALDSALDIKIPGNKAVYQLVLLALTHQNEIDYLMTKFKILENNRVLNPWDLKVIMAEMIWGTQKLKSFVAVIRAIRYYEESLREACLEVATFFPGSLSNVMPVLPVYVRVNKLQIPIEIALQIFFNEGWKLLPPSKTYSEHLLMVGSLGQWQGYFMRDFHIPDLLVFPPGTSFYYHPGYLTGKLLLQDKGSCLSSFLLNPEPGSKVLDLCAAPGLKTNHLANLMNNNGLVWANDVHPERFAALSKLFQLTNVRYAQLTARNIFNFNTENSQDPQVDYILVDPSCTYSGMFSKLGTRYQGQRVKRCSRSQSAILRYTLQSFPNVKRVVYTTCSIFPAEGEKIVDDALKEVGNSFTLVDLKKLLGKEWINQGYTQVEVSGQKLEYACGSKCLRTVPEYDLCQGHFIAIFERNFQVPVPPYKERLFKKNCSQTAAGVNIEDVSDDNTEMHDFTSDEH